MALYIFKLSICHAKNIHFNTIVYFYSNITVYTLTLTLTIWSKFCLQST